MKLFQNTVQKRFCCDFKKFLAIQKRFCCDFKKFLAIQKRFYCDFKKFLAVQKCFYCGFLKSLAVEKSFDPLARSSKTSVRPLASDQIFERAIDEHAFDAFVGALAQFQT